MSIRRRFGVLSTLAGLLATLAIVSTPTTAQAADHNCDGRVNLGNFYFLGDRWIFTVHIRDATEIFIETEARRETNGAETVKEVTYTDVIRKKVTLKTGQSLSVADTIKFSEGLSQTRTETITQETTLETETSFQRVEQIRVPPMGQSESKYGVVGYRIVYDFITYHRWDCWQQGRANGIVAEAPTRTQEWRTVYWPNTNRGGVVNAENYSEADIHPGTIVAIFGQYFVPDDTVVVTQSGGFRWEIGPGTAWWYDSETQINATLPDNLQSGRSAQIQVRGANGRVSNTRSVFVQP